MGKGIGRYSVSWNSFPIINLGGEFLKSVNRFDYFEKLFSNEYSFIIVVMIFLIRFFMLQKLLGKIICEKLSDFR